MLVAFAALLIHPQLAPKSSFSAEEAALSASKALTASASASPAEPSFSAATLANPDAPAEPAIESRAVPSNAPVLLPFWAVSSLAPAALLKPVRPGAISVRDLKLENHRKEMWWRGLIVASSGAATFDAWSTRHAITNYGAQELNPMLKPFAGNASIYAAIQVGPLLMDYAGRKMMYSRHSWLRRVWWLPQSASAAASLFCGANNLSYQ